MSSEEQTVPQPGSVDGDPGETAEWLEALSDVVAVHGPERAKFLLHEGLWTDVELPSVAEAKRPDFVKFCLGHFAAMWPIGRWLLDEVTAD